MMSDPDLLDGVLRLAAAAGCEMLRVLDPPQARRAWAEAPVVVLDEAAALRCSQSDIPWFLLSSCGGLLVGPGGGLVVGGAGLEAAVQDADQPVPELAQRCVMTDPTGAQGVVVGAGTG